MCKKTTVFFPWSASCWSTDLSLFYCSDINVLIYSSSSSRTTPIVSLHKSNTGGTIFLQLVRSSHPEVFLEKLVLKICSKFTEEHPCRSGISIKLQSNLIEITLRHGCSPVHLLHFFRTPFPENTSGWLFSLVLMIGW